MKRKRKKFPRSGVLLHQDPQQESNSRDQPLVVAERHCDDWLDDPGTVRVLREFLAFARSPAHGFFLPKPHPTLFADHGGKRVRVTMASRLGDVGITTDLEAATGYEQRVFLSELSNFSEVS